MANGVSNWDLQSCTGAVDLAARHNAKVHLRYGSHLSLPQWAARPVTRSGAFRPRHRPLSARWKRRRACSTAHRRGLAGQPGASKSRRMTGETANTVGVRTCGELANSARHDTTRRHSVEYGSRQCMHKRNIWRACLVTAPYILLLEHLTPLTD